MIPLKHRSSIRVLGGASSGDTKVGKNPFLPDKAGGHQKKSCFQPFQKDYSSVNWRDRKRPNYLSHLAHGKKKKNYEYILDLLEIVKFL